MTDRANLPLQRACRWEKERAQEIFLTQPLDGRVRDWTWEQALAEARRVAGWLVAQNWPPGSRVAIMAKNSAWWILSDLAIWMAGHVSVPIYPSLAGSSVRQIIEHSGSIACFVGRVDDYAAMKSGLPSDIARIGLPAAAPNEFLQWDAIVASTEPLRGEPVRRAEELATIIYTSGTTGLPKGVMHSFATFGWAPTALLSVTPWDQNERLLSYLPLAHVTERWLVEACALYIGCRIYFVDSLRTFLNDLQRARPTVFISVPRLWTKFQQGVFAKKPKAQLDRLMRIPLLGRFVKKKVLKELGLDSVRFAASGSAPLPTDILQWYRDLGLQLLEGYGMSENFAVSHGSQPGRARVGYVGHPWPGVDVKLSEGGEVLMKSPSLMMGYYRDPEQTRAAFTADGFLHTGDLGVIDEEGRLRITGRAKEQFKTSKGKYVSPALIENKLGGHPSIEASCVAGASFPQPFALVMLPAGEWQHCQAEPLRGELAGSLRELLEHVNAELDPHQQLDFLAVVSEQWTIENGLLTPTMKIKRSAIEQHYGGYFERWAAQRQPIVWHAA
jgi:long-chain acyl-CoA synthetase